MDFFRKKQATLPKELATATIKDMKVGDVGYTVPWAMVVDKESKLWIDGNFSISSQSGGGTTTMKVICDQDGVKIDVSGVSDYTWQPHSVGGFWAKLPVVELIR